MARVSRRAHLLLAAAFTVVVVVQFFLAGMALFTAESWHAHVDTGYFAGLGLLALPLLALAARLPLLDVFLSVSLTLAAWLQILLPQTTPWLAAFHPVWALVLLGLSLAVVRRAALSARRPAGTAPPPSSP
ncbi:MAG TPA: DUF6220 domain-containing protein [Gaiellaceae bacterium]|nr:DUF6220 domain-containing protein [Gaiellaceae bacterium]